MAITLKRLSVRGPGLLPAVVEFDGRRTLIRTESIYNLIDDLEAA